MENITVSVIIPVYHVEKYIGRCIETLREQKQEGLEFIFVDDCSDDRSMEIVRAFAAEDARVRMIFNPQNMGPGKTRNAGIEAARGEYLSFVDPDDWIAPDFYALLYRKARETGCDIAKSKTVAIDERTGDPVPWWSTLNGSIEKMLRHGSPFYLTPFFDHFSAIYKRELFADGTVRYGSTRNGEDTTFLLRVCCKTDSIQFENRAVYYYRENRSGSLMGVLSSRRLQTELDSLREKISFLCTQELDDYCYVYFLRRIQQCVNHYCSAAEKAPELLAHEQEYAARLLEIVRTIPNYQQMGERYTEMRILLEQQFFIPLRWKDNHIVRIKRWTRFFASVPHAERAYAYAFALALLHSVQAYFTDKKSSVHKINYWKFVASQLGQLSWRRRLAVCAMLPAVPLRAAYSFVKIQWKARRKK